MVFGLGNGFIDHLCTHHSELQAITAPPLISTIHKSPHSTCKTFSSLLRLLQPFPGNGF
jgi:hypothetical protein